MNFLNFRDPPSSEDNHFLQNFSPPHDLLRQFCKVESNSDNDPSSCQVKQEMDQEMHYAQGRNQTNPSKSHRHSKQKKKVFYRDKMAELMKPGEYVKQQYKYVTYNQHDLAKAPISKEEQLKRNRQSAKNSRQRKKQYVSILEQKNDENLKLIQQLNYKLEQVTLERDRLKEDNHADIKTFFKSKGEAYENLELALKAPQATSDDIKAVIHDMMVRFGTSGSERMSVINYYMNQIIEVLISDIHKYFLNCSAFTQPLAPLKPIDQDVMRILQLDVMKTNTMMLKYKQRFGKETTVFKDLTQEFYRVFKSIQNQGRVIELVFAEMMKEIDPKALGELIVWFEENKFCREVKRVQKEWRQQLKTGEEVIEVIRKQTKQGYL